MFVIRSLETKVFFLKKKLFLFWFDFKINSPPLGLWVASSFSPLWCERQLQWTTTHLPKAHKDVMEELWFFGQQSHCVQGPRSKRVTITLSSNTIAKATRCLPEGNMYYEGWEKAYNSHVPRALYAKNADKVGDQKAITYNLLCERAKI